MSETFQAPNYNTQHGTLRQLRASVIINAPKASQPYLYSCIIDPGTPRSAEGKATTATTRFTLPIKEMMTAAALQCPSEKPTTLSAAARLRVARLAGIQAALGLSTLALAQVLSRSRPTLYKWLDATNDAKLQDASQVRLGIIERIAKQWSDRAASPLSSVANEPLSDGRTALQLLRADPIEEAVIARAFDELVAKLRDEPKSRSQMLADAGITRRSSLRALPADE